MALTSYELSSWHHDPEGHLQPFKPDYDPQIWIRTQHSANMPECVAKLLHSLQVQQELDNYDLGIKPKENYKIHRQDDDYELPF